jgi:hypothetical protein
MSSVNKSRYDELAVHFERRFSQVAGFQVNYALAWSRGSQGLSDGNYPFGVGPQIPSATGGLYNAPWEYGPTSFDERHRVTVAGVLTLPFDINVSPSVTVASARPYTQYRAFNPSGDGQLMVLCPSGNSADVGFGAGQVPCGINNARGKALINANARVSKNLALPSGRRISIFAEFYNILNRANFGDQYSNFVGAADYGKPTGYLGGLGATSTIPISFQVQFGARLSF